jgi:hypothetical protein
MSDYNAKLDHHSPEYDPEGYADAMEYSDPALDANGLYPGEAKDNLLNAVETEKADKEYQLSKYSEAELKDELTRRENWHATREGRAPF